MAILISTSKGYFDMIEYPERPFYSLYNTFYNVSS